ncbi:hypothetical protein [Halobaculum litoreum]|uniref:hypothetical protein n=1 Tax=Halobaculum litoreum TaxID=3031998 RepID=UPI0024C39974|nr:hypothetical protein [Halobaculum sp. DT92]
MSDGDTGAPPDRSVGVSVPEDHVGAFVAQAFEDPERSTTWTEVVSEVVAAEARDAWDALSPAEQVQELLAVADDYDERAVEALEAVPLDGVEPTDEVDDLFEEATRCRRNADRIRDGVAAAYTEDRIEADRLADAVEAYGFDTGTVAEREDLVEAVTEAYDYDVRPYGGVLMEADDSDADAAAAGGDPW